jgi:hypothetical protein
MRAGDLRPVAARLPDPRSDGPAPCAAFSSRCPSRLRPRVLLASLFVSSAAWRWQMLVSPVRLSPTCAAITLQVRPRWRSPTTCRRRLVAVLPTLRRGRQLAHVHMPHARELGALPTQAKTTRAGSVSFEPPDENYATRPGSFRREARTEPAGPATRSDGPGRARLTHPCAARAWRSPCGGPRSAPRRSASAAPAGRRAAAAAPSSCPWRRRSASLGRARRAPSPLRRP